MASRSNIAKVRRPSRVSIIGSPAENASASACSTSPADSASAPERAAEFRRLAICLKVRWRGQYLPIERAATMRHAVTPGGALPQHMRAEGAKGAIGSNQRDALDLRLRRQHAVERIAMRAWQKT